MKSYLTYLLMLTIPYLNNYSLGQELTDFQSTISQIQIEEKYFQYKTDDEGIHLDYSNGHKVFIPQRDYPQYSSVAYAFRAILAVQPSFLFEIESLATLESEVMNYFKKSVDLTILIHSSQMDSF